MDIIPSIAPKSLTSDTTFSNYLLIVDADYNIPKLCGMDNITTEEVWKIVYVPVQIRENLPI